MEVEFQILGPLEVRIGGVPIAIGGPRQRALLAMLLLSANRVVSRDRLIDELMAGAPPANGEQPRLVARAPGYVLRVEPGELDFQRFEALLAEGHRAFDECEFERAAR